MRTFSLGETDRQTDRDNEEAFMPIARAWLVAFHQNTFILNRRYAFYRSVHCTLAITFHQHFCFLPRALHQGHQVKSILVCKAVPSCVTIKRYPRVLDSKVVLCVRLKLYRRVLASSGILMC